MKYIIFPLVMTIGLAATYFYGLMFGSPIGAAIVVSLSALVVVGVLERVMPYKREWNQSKGDVRTDFWHTITNQVLLSRGFNIIWAFALAGVVVSLVGLVGNDLWPDDWPILIQLMLMLLIAEFGRYWFHRFSHRNPWLWRLHAVHHSPKRLYFFNAGRVHPLEKMLYIIPEVVPFILLGTNIECLALYVTFNTIHGLFQHGNVNVKLGFLNYIFSMAELHRWHHSKVVAESDNNFGNNLSVWDSVFGTLYLPQGREVGELGLLADDYPQDYIGQCVAPFKKRDVSKPNLDQLNVSEDIDSTARVEANDEP